MNKAEYSVKTNKTKETDDTREDDAQYKKIFEVFETGDHRNVIDDWFEETQDPFGFDDSD